jgi:hypothetical protein
MVLQGMQVDWADSGWQKPGAKARANVDELSPGTALGCERMAAHATPSKRGASFCHSEGWRVVPGAQSTHSIAAPPSETFPAGHGLQSVSPLGMKWPLSHLSAGTDRHFEIACEFCTSLIHVHAACMMGTPSTIIVVRILSWSLVVISNRSYMS